MSQSSTVFCFWDLVSGLPWKRLSSIERQCCSFGFNRIFEGSGYLGLNPCRQFFDAGYGFRNGFLFWTSLVWGGSSTQRKQISKSRRNSLTSILPVYREPLVQSIRQTGDPGDGFEARLLPVAWIVFCGQNPTLIFAPGADRPIMLLGLPSLVASRYSGRVSIEIPKCVWLPDRRIFCFDPALFCNRTLPSGVSFYPNAKFNTPLLRQGSKLWETGRRRGERFKSSGNQTASI